MIRSGRKSLSELVVWQQWEIGSGGTKPYGRGGAFPWILSGTRGARNYSTCTRETLTATCSRYRWERKPVEARAVNVRNAAIIFFHAGWQFAGCLRDSSTRLLATLSSPENLGNDATSRETPFEAERSITLELLSSLLCVCAVSRC